MEKNGTPQKTLVEILDDAMNQIKGKRVSPTRAVLNLFEALDQDLKPSDQDRFRQIVAQVKSRLSKFTYVISDDEGSVDQIFAALKEAFQAIKSSQHKRSKMRKDLGDFADKASAAEQEELAEQSLVRINFTKDTVKQELEEGGIERNRTLQKELHSELMSKWFTRIHQNMIDLVADFGATELFFIDGDSLIFELAADGNLDWSHGGQLLHFAYLVESFLLSLQDRGGIFQLIFFHDHRAIWEDSPSRLLAREAIVHHLVSNTKFEVCLQFKNWWSADWTRYLQEQRPAFIMLSDGEPCTRGGANLFGAIVFKTFLMHLTHHRQNCALFSNLTFRDNKILAFAVQRRAYNTSLVNQLLDVLTPLCEHTTLHFSDQYGQLRNAVIVNDSRLDAEAVLKHAAASAVTTTSNDTQDLRLATTIAALARVLRDDPSMVVFAKLFLVHSFLLRHLSIKTRAQQLSQSFAGHSDTVSRFIELVQRHMSCSMPTAQDPPAFQHCNLFDLFDGRLFYKLMALVTMKGQSDFRMQLGLTTQIVEEISAAWNTICEFAPNLNSPPLIPLLNDEITLAAHQSEEKPQSTASSISHSADAVLHVRNDFINQHLDSQIRLPEIEPNSDVIANYNSTEFPFPKDADLGLIHNLNEKAILFPHTPDSNRRNQQRYYTFLHQYAASLQGIEALHRPLVVSTGFSTSTEDNAAPKKISKKAQEIIDKNKAEQEEKKIRAHKEQMKNLIEATKKESSIESMLAYLDKYIAFDGHPKIVLRAQLFRLDLLCRQWSMDLPRRSDRAAVIFRLVHDTFNYCKTVLSEKKLRQLLTPIVMMGFSAQALTMAQEAVKVMPPPKEAKRAAKKGAKKGSAKAPPAVDPVAVVRKISDTMRELKEVDEKTRRPDELSYARFQLTHCGHLMERDVDQKSDPRVLFKPDEWQRRLLDVVDADECALVVAPTSSGKTFAAYYAMDKVLRTSDTGIVVYVAPTKALVNQVAAEVYGRFSHKKTAPGCSVFGIYTKEYKINPNTCQILITLPEILEVLLLSPDASTQEWTRRIKFVIFDEIHCIGDLDGGSVWEHLLLLVRAPFIALSATVGNPEEFKDWLSKSQAKRNRKVHLVFYNQRWSDLQKYVYLPTSANPETLNSITPDPNKFDGKALVTMHPYSSLTPAKLQRFGIPPDMSLTPAEVMQLFDAIHTVVSRKYGSEMAGIARFDPDKYFENTICIKKKDARELEGSLRKLLEQWAETKPNLVTDIIKVLDDNITNRFAEMESTFSTDLKMECYDKSFMERHFLHLVATLAAQDKLPALVFSFERNICEALVTYAVQELERLESDRREGTREARVEYHRQLKKKEKEVERKRKERERAIKDMTKEQKQMALERGDLLEEVEEPDEPLDQDFTLVKEGDGIGKFEIHDVLKDLRRRMDPKFDVLIRALERGFGVHHAGLPKKYREAVETLFRRKQLKIVVSTSTLALGINMPCKTTVFAGDNIFLNSLQFRQMSGRAGRRGFDLLGHVIFFGIPQFKIHRLLTSSLSRLQGHFPLSTTLVLRLMSMYALCSAKDKPIAEESLLTMLHQPLFSLGKERLSNQMLFHFRFVLDFLIREHLLNDNAGVFGLTAIAALLFTTEPANIVLCHLFNTGVLHRICEPVNVKTQEVPESVLDKLVLVLSHFFLVRLLPPDFQHDPARDISSVVLEPLPQDIQQTIQEYDKKTLNAFSRYVRSFCRSSDLVHQDENLPCSSVQVPKADSAELSESVPLLSELQSSAITTIARSPFVALSGKDDSFDSVHDLTNSLHQGVYLDRSAVPVSLVFSEQAGRVVLKNAYLYDFWKFGNVAQLVKANRIGADTVWYLIHDFNEVLRILSIALEKVKHLPSEDEDEDEDEDEYENNLRKRQERSLPPYIMKLIIAFQQLNAQFCEKFYAAFGMA